MAFSAEFLDSLPSEPILAINEVVRTTLEYWRNLPASEESNDLEFFLEALLLRLEKVQSEMHKKMSDLDRFWGLIGDAGVALGKFGTEAKPIVDRIREISEIVWRTQARAEELPSNTPLPLLAYKDSDSVDR